jgi:hypothetical protein
MSKVSTNSITDLAETSGVTAGAHVSLFLATIECSIRTSASIPKFVKPNTFSHLGPHEGWVNNAHSNTMLLQIQA